MCRKEEDAEKRGGLNTGQNKNKSSENIIRRKEVMIESVKRARPAEDFEAQSNRHLCRKGPSVPPSFLFRKIYYRLPRAYEELPRVAW
jgi:hypothetical protein